MVRLWKYLQGDRTRQARPSTDSQSLHGLVDFENAEVGDDLPSDDDDVEEWEEGDRASPTLLSPHHIQQALVLDR